MMKAQYLLRFDDICPTINWTLWDEVESILNRYNISPLLAIVPDNQDPELHCSPRKSDFWERARRWQARGWSIALHGFQHKFVTSEAGIVGLNCYSEFAGLPARAQKEKLIQALAIFQQEQIVAQAWSAPAHSFDQVTLNCLAELGVDVISDGLFLYPQTDPQGFFWIPQQLSDFRSLPLGMFTICFHLNHWDPARLRAFEHDIVSYKERIVSLPEVIANYRQYRPLLSAQTLTKWGSAALRIKRRLRLRSRIISFKQEKVRQGIVR